MLTNVFRGTINKKEKGFTLVEILLYMAMLSIIIFSIATFFSLILQARVKNQTIAEVEQQGAQVIQLITQSIRNATALNSPSIGASAASLSLNTTVTGSNPTVFDLSGGTIRIKEGVAAVVPLTSSLVTASSLNFRNLSRAGTKGIIDITFTLSRVNSSGLNIFSYTQNFYASASLR